MTKLKELLEIYETVDTLLKSAYELKDIEKILLEHKRVTNIINENEYKTFFSVVKNLKQQLLIKKKLSQVNGDLQKIVYDMYMMREMCNDDILFLIKKKESNGEDIRDYYCPICGATYKNIAFDNFWMNSNIIDLSDELVEDINEKKLRDEEDILILKIRECINKNEEMTVDEFFSEYSKNKPEKCKKKGLIYENRNY